MYINYKYESFAITDLPSFLTRPESPNNSEIHAQEEKHIVSIKKVLAHTQRPE
jgi:hypothetical protein